MSVADRSKTEVDSCNLHQSIVACNYCKADSFHELQTISVTDRSIVIRGRRFTISVDFDYTEIVINTV